MSDTNEFKRPPLTIQGDVAAYARKAANALESSEKWLRNQIETNAEVDPEGDAWVEVMAKDLKVTGTNLTQAAAFLRWIADFEEGGPSNG
ncbi:MAG: hypothetical protein JJU21_03060 [Salinarimonas sp.]|nr:hypothetical protein [Salinarimonas sp.]